MDKLVKVIQEALDNYFKALSKLGGIDDVKTNQLFLLIILEEFLRDYESIITEDDYNVISTIINCICVNSCLVPLLGNIVPTEPLQNYLLNIPIRTVEDTNIRVVESGSLRLPNQL